MSFTYKAKFYNGYKNNIDSQRPTLGIACKKVNHGKVNLNNDYILKNIVSGKIIRSTCIRTIQQ